MDDLRDDPDDPVEDLRDGAPDCVGAAGGLFAGVAVD